jgi:hypothetical protein
MLDIMKRWIDEGRTLPPPGPGPRPRDDDDKPKPKDEMDVIIKE